MLQSPICPVIYTYLLVVPSRLVWLFTPTKTYVCERDRDASVHAANLVANGSNTTYIARNGIDDGWIFIEDGLFCNMPLPETGSGML